MRYSSIDCLRTVAIVVMVLVHFAENLSGVFLPITGLGAPLFAFLSGLSYCLWLLGLESHGVSDEEISKRSIRRGLFVFGIGFFFNILVWLPADVFNWDVLTFIGFAILLLNGLRYLPLPVAILVAVVCILISPILRNMADFNSYWIEGHFESDLTLSDVLIGFFATGYFPVFPWLAYSVAGLVTGKLMFQSIDSGASSELASNDKSSWKIIIFGAGLMAVSGFLLMLGQSWPAAISRRLLGGWNMFPATIEYVLATLGMAMVLLGGVHNLIDRRKSESRRSGWFDVAKTFSRYSFTIYVLHHLVHLWPMWIWAVAEGKEPTIYWQKAIPLAMSLPLAFVFLAASYFLLRKIGPDRRWGIEGWMRWLCD
jgi:Heparan-alpha-glucosaminide N-acetyltransferase, catalytic